MWIAAARATSGWRLQRLDGAGHLQGEPWAAARVTDGGPPVTEGDPPHRYVWSSTAALYPAVLADQTDQTDQDGHDEQDRGDGQGVARCHDLAAVHALLTRGSSLAAPAAEPLDDGDLPALFDLPAEPAPEASTESRSAPSWPDLASVAGELARQREEIDRRAARFPGFRLLVAAESACTLAAVEMTRAGLPWRAEVHDRLLQEALGPRPRHGGRPAVMQRLAEQVCDELGAPGLNVDSLPDLLRAMHRAGIPVRTTRAHELRSVQHPVIEPLLRYRELARLFTANGWAWREQWAPDGRFRPEYIPAGVVSGRWASRGGGALQIPRALREAVVADDGRRLVVADAGQLEPRVLAVLSGDRAMLRVAASSEDLYSAVARELFGSRASEDPRGLRHEVKIALLAAMYGGGTGSAALAALRRRFPAATALLEDAAGQGESGGIVHSVLGRPCPPVQDGWFDAAGEGIERSSERARGRGRFTRNFVVQASAADWANVLVASLRRELHELARRQPEHAPAELVFFQHDEIVVDTPQDRAEDVVEALGRAGAEATRLVLGAAAPQIPLEARVVRSYAERPPATGPTSTGPV